MPDNNQPELPPIPTELPVVATVNMVLFPFMVAPLTVGRAVSLKALDAALEADRLVAVAMQKTEVEEPGGDDLHEIGCVGVIMRLARTPEGQAQVIVQGLQRVRLGEVRLENGTLQAKLEPLPDTTEKSTSVQALMNNLMQTFQRIVDLSPMLPEEALQAGAQQTQPGALADFVGSALNLEPNVRQELLEEFNVQKRLERVTELAANEVSVLELTTQIHAQTRKELDKGQREFVLRQQLREIQKQLGDEEDPRREIEELQRQVEEADMPEEVRIAADRELKRLERVPQASPEYSVARNYLDYLVSIPWSKSTEDNLDIAHAQQVLNEDHFDLEDVKERILEYLAVRRLNPNSDGPILCFVGPPGVGKTSLAHSIARALGRKFVRMALGGVRDEAEIRGHRRTYIGALPGRIVQGLRDAGTNNPVMILDEIDKLGADYRGDPTSALLEVLDPQQNNGFKDHYLEVPIDLSNVMFITTANVLDTIPAPLRDRMEILRLPGYTLEEKVAIARRYLLPRQREQNGLEEGDITVEDSALEKLVLSYTREAGVRNLERALGRICRKAARQVAETIGQDGVARPHMEVTADNLDDYMGPEKFQPEMGGKEATVGVTTGMAWTAMGGEILFIETAKLPGSGGLTLTGQLGEVMKESAQIALDYLRANCDDLKIPLDCKAENSSHVHVHVPAGAVPKDGPSAGVAITAALASLLSGYPARHDIALTGEVTLTGRVLPVGGIKEKVLAARQAGITNIILPARNRADVQDIPEETRQEFTFTFVDDVSEVLDKVLVAPSKNGRRKKKVDKSAPPSQATPLEQDIDRVEVSSA